MSDRRVVVTGMGCVTPLGNDLATTWCAAKNGKSGVRPITHFDASRLPVRFAGLLRGFDACVVLGEDRARTMDAFQRLAYAAALEAMRHAQLEVTSQNADRIGVVIGSGVGGLCTLGLQFDALFENGPGSVSPLLSAMVPINTASAITSILLGAKGPNFGTVSACATGAHAIGESAEIVRRGQADAMIAGGTESAIVEIGMAAFSNMRALSTRNDEPERASRPFDAERDGFVMGEGSGTLVLESLDHALARGAPILAEVVGYGSTADASHVTDPAPGGEGAARGMRMALERAGMRPEDIQYVNAHGTSTVVGDRAETAAIRAVFGNHANSLAVSSTKSMMGHLFGAAGAVEAILCVQAIQTGFVPPTINYEHPDPECDLDYVPNVGRAMEVESAMNNSFGFGGHNVTLVFRRYPG